MRWQKQDARFSLTVEGERGLAIVALKMAPRMWMLVGLETTLAAATRGAEGVFADHSHEVIGEAKTIREMSKLARAFVRKWRKSVRAPRCDCTSP